MEVSQNTNTPQELTIAQVKKGFKLFWFIKDPYSLKESYQNGKYFKNKRNVVHYLKTVVLEPCKLSEPNKAANQMFNDLLHGKESDADPIYLDTYKAAQSKKANVVIEVKKSPKAKSPKAKKNKAVDKMDLILERMDKLENCMFLLMRGIGIKRSYPDKSFWSKENWSKEKDDYFNEFGLNETKPEPKPEPKIEIVTPTVKPKKKPPTPEEMESQVMDMFKELDKQFSQSEDDTQSEESNYDFSNKEEVDTIINTIDVCETVVKNGGDLKEKNNESSQVTKKNETNPLLETKKNEEQKDESSQVTKKVEPEPLLEKKKDEEKKDESSQVTKKVEPEPVLEKDEEKELDGSSVDEAYMNETILNPWWQSKGMREEPKCPITSESINLFGNETMSQSDRRFTKNGNERKKWRKEVLQPIKDRNDDIYAETCMNYEDFTPPRYLKRFQYEEEKQKYKALRLVNRSKVLSVE